MEKQAMSKNKDFISLNLGNWTGGERSGKMYVNIKPLENKTTFVVEFEMRKYFDCKDYEKAEKLYKELDKIGMDLQDFVDWFYNRNKRSKP